MENTLHTTISKKLKSRVKEALNYNTLTYKSTRLLYFEEEEFVQKLAKDLFGKYSSFDSITFELKEVEGVYTLTVTYPVRHD